MLNVFPSFPWSHVVVEDLEAVLAEVAHLLFLEIVGHLWDTRVRESDEFSLSKEETESGDLARESGVGGRASYLGEDPRGGEGRLPRPLFRHGGCSFVR